MRLPSPAYLALMIRRILILLVLIGVAAGGVFAWLAWPHTAELPIQAVQGVRPTITAPTVQTIPTVNIAEPVGWGYGDAVQDPVSALERRHAGR